MSPRVQTIVASLILLIGVGAGAFGAHGLKQHVGPDMLATWQTAVLYQLVHGLGLLALAVLHERRRSALLRGAGLVMLAGILIFSGSLYALVLTGHKWLGAVTPIGGVAFLLAWGMTALAAYRQQQ
ncbi:MAG: DUF423 domain-containing protein [Alcaligenaceae bacterium]|nr:DUF423 domain-containing protein [Alcaligenaceae bacterium]